MTQSVTDKTPIPEKSWRRHSDPPGLWIAVATISFTLHLLLFWLLRSYSYNLLSQRNSSNPIPVEFVEISSQPKASSNAKPVLSTKPSTTQKSSVTSSPKLSTQGNLTPKSTSTIEDSNAITLANPISPKTSQPQVKDKTQQPLKKPVIKQEQPNPEPIATSQPTPQPEPFIAKTPEPPLQPTPEDTPQAQQPQPTPKQTPEPPLQPTPEAQQPQPTPEPTTLADNSDTQNQPLQNQTPNPQNNTTDSTRPDSSPETGEQAKQPNESTESPGTLPKQPDEQVIVGKETPLPDLAPPVKPEQSPLDEPKVGGFEALWYPEADKLKKDIPENLAQQQDNSRRKELNIVLPDSGRDFQPVDFLVWLTIDQEGKLQFIKVDQEIPLPQRSEYQKYANEIFQDQKFVPASDKDPATGKTNPRWSSLPVRVKIQRKSPES
ncbi:hypothetical protein DP113_32320 [Brasilonema octagenarum UFV-E1]|uniref:Uncharacterized protein n=1 Tax=Brasilonema sennae CENA114 TaxID=415709 RepID=A0A856MR59_9CYAN|nr:hypothetical protein [Brasilonema sennae]QDL11947.1 hypothetical protein DP114_32220 [Brasilonema sennae CENA114]QDL18322.1 hypothetical protein DP113_32320 [Brasilonema octagenarum UFV-E1]